MKSLYNKATLTDRLFAGLAAFALVVAMVPVSTVTAAKPEATFTSSVSPNTIVLGETKDLTFTVTNTSEGKNAWEIMSFTVKVPAGFDVNTLSEPTGWKSMFDVPSREIRVSSDTPSAEVLPGQSLSVIANVTSTGEASGETSWFARAFKNNSFTPGVGAEFDTNETANLTIIVTPTPSETGVLVVNKEVVNSTSSPDDFSFTLNGGDPIDFVNGTFVLDTAPVGSHTIAEVPTDNYVATYGGNCNADGTLTITAGATTTCTITNTYEEPTPPIVVTTTGGGGSCINCGPRGDVAGEATSVVEERPEPTTELVTTTPRPEGMVGGEQVSIVPVGAPATGAGGTSGTPMQAIPMMALLALVASLAVLRRTAHEA